MKFQINNGWSIGATLIPPSTILDYGDKPDDQLTEWERLAQSRVPPLDCCALDADCAMVMWRSVHPDLRHRLYRKLDQHNEKTFQQMLGMPEATLERHWPRAKG